VKKKEEGGVPEELRWIRLAFVDVFGGSHAVQLPADRFELAVQRGAPFDGSALEGRARHLEADMLLRPDPATVLHLGGGLGRAACTVLDRDGSPWPGDPRTALSNVVDEVGELAEGYRAAAELEFYLLAGDAPVDRGGYFGDLEGPGLAVTRSAAQRLSRFGIGVISAHLEAGPGQYELDLAPMGPMALADALILAKQVIRETAAENGVRATFMARPLGSEPGSGLHLHQEVEGRLFDGRGQLDDDGRAFVGGQLAHARGLTALAAPNVNSYKRLHAGPEAPTAAVWAHSNRAAFIRVGSSVERRPAIEFRLADPAANPYLLIAGLLVSAAHGLETGADPGSPFEEDLGGYDPAAAESMQLQPLPRDLDGALDALLADDTLVDAFDSRLLQRLVDGRRAEAEAYRSQVTAWEFERFVDEA
jgi:glutamine synthetase